MNDKNKNKIMDYCDKLRDILDEWCDNPSSDKLNEWSPCIKRCIPGIQCILIKTAFAPISCAAMPSWDDIDDSARLVLCSEFWCLLDECPEGTFDETVKLVSRSDLQQILRVDIEVNPDNPKLGRQIVAYLNKQ